MFAGFFLLLALTKAEDLEFDLNAPIPAMSMFFYDPQGLLAASGEQVNKDQLSQAIKEAREYLKQLDKNSQEYKYLEYMIKIYESVQSVIVAKSYSELGDISTGSDYVMVFAVSRSTKTAPIDLTHLKSSMRVTLMNYEVSTNGLTAKKLLKTVAKTMAEMKFKKSVTANDRTFTLFTAALSEKIHHKIIKHQAKNGKAEEIHEYLKGNCGETSFLSIIDTTVQIVGESLTPNVYLSYGSRITGGKGINSEYVICSTDNQIDPSLLPVKRYFLAGALNSNQGCGVKYTNTYAQPLVKNPGSSTCYPIGPQIKYSSAKLQIGVIMAFVEIELQADSSFKKFDVDFNISIQNLDIPTGIYSKLLEDQKIKVTQSGDWSKATGSKLVIEAENPDLVEVPADVKGLTIEKKAVVPYEPKTAGGGGLSTGATIGIVVAVVVVVAIVVGLCVYFLVIKKKKAVANS